MIDFANQKVLILAPHLDDETIGCAGIIQRFREAGSEVRVLAFTHVHGTFKKFDKVRNEYVPYQGIQRYVEFGKALELLGVRHGFVLLHEFRDNIRHHLKMDGHPISFYLGHVENYVKLSFEPTVVLAPAPSKNQDHRVVNELAKTLVRPYFLNASLLEYEVDGEVDFLPDFFVELTLDQADRKVAAIAAYETQNSGPLHPTSPEAQMVKMRYRGQSIYAPFAEAFRVVRVRG